VAAWQLLGQREPICEGKPLSAWLQADPLFFEEADDKTTESGRSAVVIRHIGTNALPYLIRMVRVKDSPLKRLIISALPSLEPVVTIFRPAKEARQMAAFGFYVLGPMGKGAVPALTELLRDHDAGVEYDAARSLGFIGPDAQPAIPRLLALIYHPDRVVARTAISSLGRIRSEPSVVVPALITYLLSTNLMLSDSAMLALGEFGERAKAATSLISPFLNDADEMIRCDVTNVLKQINPEVAAKAGIK
jgi:HEAT repeat protein